MLTTKERIIGHAQKLFSEHGVANTRLQNIADKSGISTGNLAYHFSTKEEIVQTVYFHSLEELSEILIKPAVSAGIGNFDNLFSAMFHFMEENIFYFTNFWEIKRNYSVLNEKVININNKVLSRLKTRIARNVENGLFKKEEHKAGYYLLARAILISFNTWISQHLLTDKPLKESAFKLYIWNLLYPFLTEKGKQEFKEINVF